MAGIRFFKTTDGKLSPVAEVDFLEPNLNLLAHAQAIELEVGSRCGGHGICGGDQLRILSSTTDVSAPTEVERQLLGSDALANGIRLGCQVYPKTTESIIDAEIMT